MYNPVHIISDMISLNRGLLISAHIADIHFTAFDPVEQFKILHEQFIEVIKNIPRLDIISINGDIYDHKIMTSSDGALYASLFIDEVVQVAREKQATLILIHGTASHDADQLKAFYHYLNDHTIDIRIVTSMQFIYTKNAKILCIPELYGLDEEVYQQYLFYSGNYDAVFMHGTIEGAVIGNNVGNARLFTMNDFINCRGPIISGHIHKPMTLHRHCYYSGSPYPWKIDDDHQKGFLLFLQNLDTRQYYMHFQHINSYKYETIDLDLLVSEDPKDIIAYINRIKEENGIDVIRIRFNSIVPGHCKVILSNAYRNNKNVRLEFLDNDQERTKNIEDTMNELNEFSFILDKNKSEEQIFVEYCNYMENNDKFITIERLKEILNSNI